MKARALLVPIADGEAARKVLSSVGALRSDLAIHEEGDELALPLELGALVPAGLGRIEDREFAPRRNPGPRGYYDLLDWPEDDKEMLPRSFDVIGDIVLIRLPVELRGKQEDVGRALLDFVPGARLIGLDHGVQGTERIRSVERIAGTGGWATRHRENQLELDVDVERAYFSPRLAREHALVAEAVSAGERVYDLCCGVGPFTVAIAKAGRARQVTAVDLNPSAIELLCKSVGRYRLQDRVTPLTTSVEDFAANASPVERVILNLPREGIKYGPLVARLVAPGGDFHYYEVVSRDEADGRADAIRAVLPPRGAWVSAEQHIVHPYSPSSDLVAFRFHRCAG